ncbi:MAG: hypothetical protein QOE98_631 [Gaiellaceae bacterium]|nr:hypothetical protein [Gaiellaceae bacterium]
MLAAILVVALVLRLWSLRHGLPFVYNVDEEQHFVSRAARFFGGDLDPRYFENPPGLTYVLWVAFAVRYAGDDVRALFRDDPASVYLTGRMVVAVLGTAVVAATYALGARLARDRVAGLVAAGLMAVGFIPVWYSKLALNDMPAVLPATVAVVFALRHLDEGRRRDLLLAGLAAGVAAGTKYTAGAAFLAVAVAGAPRLRLLAGAAIAALAGAVLVNPWFVLDPGRILDAMQSQGERSSVAKVGGTELPAPLFYLDSFGWGLGLPAALLAVAGLVLAARDGPRRLATAAGPALVLLVAISLFDRAFARWALPAYPLVAALAGIAVARGAARLRWPAAMAAAAGVLACLPGALASVHLDRVLARTDTRLEARRFLLAEAAPGTRIVVEPTLPSRLTAGVRGARPFSVLARGFDVQPQPADVDAYRQLGACYVLSQHTYRQRMEARDRALSDAYYRRLREASDGVRTFSPFRAGTTVPLHFDWSFDYYPDEYVRPGTEVTIYHLRGCTPSVERFPPSFRNPYRDSLSETAVQTRGNHYATG